ncbi:hypothetical protein BJX68DRAFT_228771 [Aspergillus pseudodeflectus]|uniref:Uncharacterized protein n=1 Tax=Aspergillus pseudodeflectus TaxID=176178 RepID=A0ABR4KZY5_9EURO
MDPACRYADSRSSSHPYIEGPENLQNCQVIAGTEYLSHRVLSMNRCPSLSAVHFCSECCCLSQDISVHSLCCDAISCFGNNCHFSLLPGYYPELSIELLPGNKPCMLEATPPRIGAEHRAACVVCGVLYVAPACAVSASSSSEPLFPVGGDTMPEPPNEVAVGRRSSHYSNQNEPNLTYPSFPSALASLIFNTPPLQHATTRRPRNNDPGLGKQPRDNLLLLPPPVLHQVFQNHILILLCGFPRPSQRKVSRLPHAPVGVEVVVQALDGARGDADLFCDGLLGEGLREEAADLDAESGFLDLGLEEGVRGGILGEVRLTGV